jgi:hypothetical protein
MTAVNPRLALAAAKYLCRHYSVGLLRMALDLLKDPELREVWRSLGIDPAQAQAGGPLLIKAVRVLQEHVEYLEQRGAARYVETAAKHSELMGTIWLPGVKVANWAAKPCTDQRQGTP